MVSQAGQLCRRSRLCTGLRQHEIADAEAGEQAAHTGRQVAAMAQQPAPGDGQLGYELEPLLLVEPCDRDRRRGRLRFPFRQVADQPRISQPQPRLAHDAGPHLGRQRQLDLGQPGIGRRDLLPAPSVGRRSEEVEQLPELRTRRLLAVGAGAQDSGKAVVEQHLDSTRAEKRRMHSAARCRLAASRPGEIGA